MGVDCWRYVQTEFNSADIATRYNKKLKFDSVLWWKGPLFLSEGEEKWPRSELNDISENIELNQETGEVLVATSFTSESVERNVCNVIDCERYGSLEKLLKVTCFVKRFIRNLKAKIGRGDCLEGDLSVDEMNEAKFDWCRYEQSFIIKDKHFEKQKLSLNLFCDEKGLYRSNTRVNPGKLKYVQTFPILLRSNSYFTRLVVLQCHEDVHHCGLESTLNKVRCVYWVIKGRQTVKKIISKCVICKVIQGKTLLPPSTAKLPNFRVYFEFPFENAGLDYAGPLYTRDIYSSSKETFKSYILIFTCAATRNSHLELVPTESTESLLLALRRFVARKGLPSTFISDNFKTFKAKEIKRFILKLKVNWKFILEKSPWWGGFYERLIGIIKRCLKKVAGKAFLNYDELTTLLIEIEQTLNTRPLTYLSDNNDDEAVTPSHLLYGRNIARRNCMYLDPEYDEQENSLLNKYKRLKMILSHFKKRFYDEYILALRERHQYEIKKTNNFPVLKINDIVLIKEDKPRIRWRKGKIIKLLHSNDNLIRGVELITTQTSNKKVIKIRRPIQMIIPLEVRNEINDNNDDSDKNDNNNENDDINYDNLNQRDDLDDLHDKIDFQENRKSKRIAAINADIIRRLNDV